ncbi:MAG: di-heme oxidoredictase family protein, partial [Steroidobacteraceae bacterium]
MSGTRIWVPLAAALLTACGPAPEVAELLDPNSGGATTVHESTRNAYSQPAANLDVQRRGEFFIGNAFFNSAWVVAPATAAARDGLGPLFNARSCDACHANDGRGQPPVREGERPISLVMQFATPTPGANNEPDADPRYGANLNPFAIGGVPAEGTVRIRHRVIRGKFADGEEYTLAAPEYSFEELAYGELASDTRFSPRVSPSVFGVGLLQAVRESQILERSDPDDQDRDGISGRPNHVWDHVAKRTVLGRLGWKANQPDIAHQTAAAFAAEIGMSSSLRPQQNCTTHQAGCVAAPDGGKPEVSDEIFARIVRYQRMLAVPIRRNLDSSEVRHGAELFLEAGCTACHRPTLTTAEDTEEPWLSRQTIHPYTDLLLHDMGEALGDGRSDFEATGTEWRTPPLWGLGLQQTVNGHTRLLHDGRARNVQEAILWHGGEAEPAAQSFRAMSRADRAA